jgi:hypothetical protein
MLNPSQQSNEPMTISITKSIGLGLARRSITASKPKAIAIPAAK